MKRSPASSRSRSRRCCCIPSITRCCEDPERHLDRDYSPEDGGVNPFLHLSLHLAVAEQLSIDQPAGIRGAFEELRRRLASEHDALHAVLECLGETLWQAQRQGTAPDERAYLDCLAGSCGAHRATAKRSHRGPQEDQPPELTSSNGWNATQLTRASKLPSAVARCRRAGN